MIGTNSVKINEKYDLLEEYNAKLLTLDEAYNADIVFYESNGTSGSEYGRLTPGSTKYSTGIRRICYSGYAYEDDREYGSSWRCWNVKPSDKQSKNTPWRENNDA